MHRSSALAFGLSLIPAAAFAHPGHEGASAFTAGLTHPIGGADHLLAMLAVGLLAGAAGGKARLVLPLSFLGAMAAGGFGGALGLALPAVEPMILASVVVFCALLALGLRLPLALMALMVAAFGLFHGNAHGLEAPASGFAAYAAAFTLSTAALHGAGLLIARSSLPQRLIGALTAAAGVALALV